MHFTSASHLDAGVLERDFTLDDVPGVLWTPACADPSAPVPLILLGMPPLGLARMRPRLADRARRAAADGFASATIELPGSGERPRVPALERGRAELRRAMAAGEPVGPEIIDALVLPLVDLAVPEWRATLDALLEVPGVGGPVGYSGGVISIGVRLAAVEPRIAAAGLFAGSLLPRATFEEARRVTVPLHVLLQWDDEGNDRQASLDLFDAFGSAEKSLSANMGGHTGVPEYAGEAAAGFFARHLKNAGK
ncbi:alpha/beta hydrolase [Kitasatospora sp. NPDC057198]|uniref:alpha/beta hydrolase n=1 Tax=Kitasatospora sp. NPDC057198 TaxID=3346046 RepID=UPI003639E277